MPVTIGPCDWDVPDPTCCTKPDWDTLTSEEKAKYKRWAAWLLWTATGRQLGRCETKIRPCRKSCANPVDWPPRPDGRMVGVGRWMASITNPAMAAWAGGLCGCDEGQHTCSCGELCQIHLPGRLVEPVRVVIDGYEMAPETFRVDDGNWLVWQRHCNAGNGCHTCFPTCQDLSLPDGYSGTWSITYRHGIPVPQEGLDAAAEVACEIAKACGGAGPGECRLPANVVAMTRAGVSYEFPANNGVVTNATGRIVRFNIPIVDMWVQSINPYGVTDEVRAWTPDMQPFGRVTTWP